MKHFGTYYYLHQKELNILGDKQKRKKKKRIKEWQPPAALKNVKRKKNRNRTQFLQVKAELCLSFKDKQTTGANDQIAQ